jgi:hypothetical protein
VYSVNILEAPVEGGRHEYVPANNWDIDRLPPQIRSFGIEIVHRPRLGRILSAVLKNTLEYPGLIRRLRCQAIFHARPTSLLGGLRKSVVVACPSRHGGFPGLMIFAENIQDDPLIARPAFGALALFIVIGCVKTEKRHPFRKPRAFAVAGAACHSIYLLHPVALSFGAHLTNALSGRALPLNTAALLLAGAGLYAGLIFYPFAEPFLTKAAKRGIQRLKPSSIDTRARDV